MSTIKSLRSLKFYGAGTSPLGQVVNQYSSDDYRGPGHWFFGKDGVDYFFRYGSQFSPVDAYRRCAPLQAIINRKAEAYINGKTWILDRKGKEATTKEANKLRKLFAQPNPLQSWDQFEAQGKIYLELWGYYFILAIKPAGYKENIDASALWNIPPFMVKLEDTKKLFRQGELSQIISKITITYQGQETEIELNDIFIMKDITPSFDTLILPDSKLSAVQDEINNIIGAYESRNVLINYRGALGILTSEKDQFGAIPIKENEKQQLQEDFRRYGLRKKQWQFIVTSASLKWQAMGYPTKELMLFEEVEDGIMRLCDLLNYPFLLLSNVKGATFANMKEAKQILYQDAIIPESKRCYGQWNKFFNTEKYGLVIDKDYSHVPALQKDKGAEAMARKTLVESLKQEWELGLITVNRMLELLGEDTLGSEGEIRITDVDKSSGPLAVAIGVGGVQALISVLTNPDLSEQAKAATLEILFGIAPADAARMAAGATATQNANENEEEVGGNTPSGNNAE